MSRIGLSLGAAFMLCSTALSAQDADTESTGESSAEDTAPLSAEDVLADSETLVGPPLPPECEPDPFNENRIVICARRNDEEFRVPRRIDPERVDAYGDVPRAPDVFGIPNHGVPIPFGSVPEPVLLIDLEAIPEAPPGSDADRVARGLAPRGNDGGSAARGPEPDAELAPEN